MRSKPSILALGLSFSPETNELPLFKLREDEAVWARTTTSMTKGGSQK